MKALIDSLKPALLATLFFTLLLGMIYPLFLTGVGQLFFHRAANGSMMLDKNKQAIGSEWIGQNFTRPEYFHPRPSQADYDAAHSAASNLGPTSQKLIDALKERATAYRRENKLAAERLIPADAVTSSASGLDPHISVANALLQAPRIASARGISEDMVKKILEKHTEGPFLGLFGEPRINVLKINLALNTADR